MLNPVAGAAVVAAAMLLLDAGAAAAQSVAERVASVRAGAVRMRFDSRPGVCGDGRSLIGERYQSANGYTIYTMDGSIITNMDPSGRGDSDFSRKCLAGPVLVEMSLRDGRVTELRPAVGPDVEDRGGRGTDLGRVSGAEAARFLLGVAREGDEQLTRNAMLAASLAADAGIAPDLVDIARDKSLRVPLRESALRWIGRVQEREPDHDADAVVRRIAGDETDVLAVRERAIRTIRHDAEGDRFLRDLYGRLSEVTLKERVIRVLAESDARSNVDFLRAVATDDREQVTLRERAIRVLGDELRRRDELRALYPRLREVALKERVIRVVGENGDAEAARWLRGIAEDPRETLALRERAIRVLGELGETDYLRSVYRRVEHTALKERILRLAGEAGGEPNTGFLRQVALDDQEGAGLRERALRSASEASVPTGELVRLYDELADRPLRERLVRIFAERGDRESIDKLIAIARSDRDVEMRRAAIRRLAESRDPRAKRFLEETIR